MTSIAPPAHTVDLPPEIRSPAWTQELLAGAKAISHAADVEGVTISSRSNAEFCLLTAHLHRARSVGREQLSERVYQSYSRLAAMLATEKASHPVRFWNHICHIHEPMGEAMDRYMAFNDGRFRAFEQWFGGVANFDKCVATASGVGCRGEDIVIHVLGARREGIAVSNPRQVQPFRYSRRFGPRPPCFARATALAMEDGRVMLFIGGTASIKGEESLHIGNLAGQLEETFENLRALVGHAGHVVGRTGTLEQFSDIRIYVVGRNEAAGIEKACRTAMPNLKEIQTLDADICRKELLVEIEGRAIL